VRNIPVIWVVLNLLALPLGVMGDASFSSSSSTFSPLSSFSMQGFGKVVPSTPLPIHQDSYPAIWVLLIGMLALFLLGCPESKKGQVTMFIIIAIIILFASALFFYLRSYIQGEQVGETAIIRNLKVDKDILPVQEYVEQCLIQTSEEALDVIRWGGVINITAWPSLMINPADATESAVYPLSDDRGIPYWLFVATPNRIDPPVTFSGYPPPLTKAEDATGLNYSMEAQMEKYIGEKMPECLDGFRPIKELYQIDVTPQGNASVTASVTEDDVRFLLRYPLDAQKDANTYHTEEYYIIQPIHLKAIYEAASKLTALEAKTSYMEIFTLSLIDMFSSSKDEQALPPRGFRSQMTLGFEPQPVWDKMEVEANVKNILASYLPMLKVVGTKITAEPPEQLINRGLYYSSMVYNLNASDPYTQNLEVDFLYNPAYIYFDLDCDGGICRSNTVPFNIWQQTTGMTSTLYFTSFSYEISYPVIITIRDPSALNGKGYDFFIAVEGNIRVNRPLTTNFPTINYAQPPPAPRTLLCEPEMRTSGNVSLIAKDYTSGRPVGGAEIYFGDGLSQCYMGKTNSGGAFTSPFPILAKGIIEIKKQGYDIEAHQAVTTLPGRPWPSAGSSQLIALEPQKELNVSLHIRPLRKSGNAWSIVDDALALQDGQYARISFSRIPIEEGDYFKDMVIPPVALENGALDSTTLLFPGTYDVEVTFVPNETVHIPEKTIHGGLFAPDVTIPAIDTFIPPLPVTARFTIDRDELYDKSEIIVYGLYYDLASAGDKTIDDLAAMDEDHLPSMIQANQGLFAPEIQ